MTEKPFSLVMTLDTQPLRERLESLPALFGAFNWRQETYIHSGMTDIWVRANDPANIGPHFNDMHYAQWYPCYWEHLYDVLRPIIRELIWHVDGENLGGIIITKLPPKGKILPHKDKGWHAQFYEKFYVAVKNNPRAVFGFTGGEIRAKQGEVYCFDDAVTHWVDNNGLEDRLSLIVCIRTKAQAKAYGNGFGFCVDAYGEQPR